MEASELSRRVAHATYALLVAWRDRGRPVKGAEVHAFDREARSAEATGNALARARRAGLAVRSAGGRFKSWHPTTAAFLLEADLKRRVEAETVEPHPAVFAVLPRIASRTQVTEGGCWLVQGPERKNGYQRIWHDGRELYAHRWAYEQLVGPIPEGLQLDHLCRNRACCNPAHLEPVTSAENTRRGQSAWAANRRKTHCIRGHEFTPENTRIGKKGDRQCLECRRIYRARERARKRKGLARAER